MINRGLDVKLNVRPVYIALVHEAYYEGPCRFGSGDALQPGYDTLIGHQLFADFVETVKNAVPPEVNLLEPVYVERTDGWVTKESVYEALLAGNSETDFYIVNSGIGRSDITLEFAQRVRKPIAIAPDRCCEVPIINAALRSRGLEVYAARTWKELAVQIRALRLRKVLCNTSILLAVRMNSQASMSAVDTFISLDQVTEKLGVKFRYINIHELLDEMSPLTPDGNYTTPGRKTANITEEEIAEMEELADKMMAAAQEVHVEKKFLVNSLKAYATVKKNLDLYDCNAFSMPCPDTCSTRRLNQLQFTPCLIHSLLNEQGIPSACEYDINAALSMMLLEAVSGNAAYMGNTNVLPLEDGKLLQMDGLSGMKFPEIEDKTNLYHTWHSVHNRKLHGINAEDSPFAIRHFAYDQKFGAVLRYDYNRDAGQVLTTTRFSPDLKKLFVGRGVVVCGGDMDKDNCNNYLIYRVADQKKYFDAQMEVGTHLPLVYGDFTEELCLLGQLLGMEVLSV
ncbi:MAG: fucose isomerase [Oscillospiraceae bacterium]